MFLSEFGKTIWRGIVIRLFYETFFEYCSYGDRVAPVIPTIMEFNRNQAPSPITSIAKPGCTIKGNISINSGNKIYHLAGMEDYESTVISPAKGQRWFCTESLIDRQWLA
ncbi:MAG: hypothetical protein WBA39_33970 [Rivularia sp. (in: cyanobacteria)]